MSDPVTVTFTTSGLAATGRRGTADQGGGTAQAWHREMERAQMANWFLSGIPAGGREAGGPGHKSPLPSAPASGASTEVAAKALPGERFAGPAVNQMEPSLSRSARSADAAAFEALAISSSPKTGIASNTVALDTTPVIYGKPWHATSSALSLGATAAVVQGIDAPSERQASVVTPTLLIPAFMGHSALRQVRTYLENTDAGVAVWLGVDGIDQQVMDQLPMLAREISRSLQTQGERLASITLNGRVVWRHDQVTAQQSSDFLLET